MLSQKKRQVEGFPGALLSSVLVARGTLRKACTGGAAPVDLRTFTENSQISTQRELGTRKLREKTPNLPAARAVAGEGGGV